MPNAHAKIGPSAAKRWLRCPGSIERSSGYTNVSGVDAARGTASHELLEKAIKTGAKPSAALGTTVAGVKVDRHIVGWAEDGAAWVAKYRAENPGALLMSERSVDIGLAFGLPVEADGRTALWGTADLFAFSRGELVTFDFKTGRHDVDVEENEQLLLYASGFAHETIGIERIRLVILQPRSGGAKEWGIDVHTFRAWQDSVRPAVLAASEPDAAIVPGDQQCQWCLARHDCEERREWAQAFTYDWAAQ